MNYLAFTLIVILFVIGQAYVKPVKNNFINVMDIWLMYNITFVYATTWFYVITRQLDIIDTISVVCILLVFINFLLILVYHLLWVTGSLPKVERKISRARQEMVRLLHALRRDSSINLFHLLYVFT